MSRDMPHGHSYPHLLSHKADGWMAGDTANDERAKRAFQGFIMYTVGVPDSQEYQNFEQKTIEYTSDTFDIEITDVCHDDNFFNQNLRFRIESWSWKYFQLSSYAQNLYDAVYLYAYSLQNMFTEDPTSTVKEGRTIANHMMNFTFDG